MSRRDKAGGKAIRVRRRKTSTRRSAAVGTLRDQLDRGTRELNESREQQAATLEVLKVISSSPGDLARVFDAILERATRLCEATHGHVWRFDGEWLHVAAVRGDPQFVEWLHQHSTVRPIPGSAADRIVRGARFDHMADRREESAYRDNQTFRGLVDTGGIRASLSVALRSDETLLGMINVYRQEIRPFTDKQIALVENFAAQAVIAIENARLLNELRESLQQQTATSDVLKVISRSTFDLSVVLNTLVESAVRLCDGYDSVILLREGEWLTFGAHHGPMPMDFDKWPLTRSWTAGRAVIDAKPVHVHDLTAVPDEFPDGHAMAIRLGHRTILSVPLLREGEAIGSLTVRRAEVRPFTDKQIELVGTFADQAVIAIENVRLFDEVQARTRDLSESLEQQTATSEVLKVISSSPGELGPVFQAMLENAVRICDAKFGNLWLREGDNFRIGATHGAPPAYAELRRREPVIHFSPGNLFSRIIATKQPQHIADITTHQAYIERLPGPVGIVDKAGARTVLQIPMLKENELIGIVAIYRQEVRPFTDKQIELVQNFAAQAVIAIENTRLLNELRESLQQQTATADVLKVISASPGQLEPVFDAMLENAVRICEAKFGNLWLREGDALRIGATHGTPPAYADLRRRDPIIHPHATSPLGRLVATRQVVHIADIRLEQAYIERDLGVVAIVEAAGARTVLLVPMLKENEVVGLITIYRQEVRPFTDKQIELVKNFAAQAVIAIENTRLLSELRESLQQQTATADVLKVISRSTFDLQLVLDTLVESATRLCEAKDAFIFLRDGELYRVAARYGFSPQFQEYLGQHPRKADRGSVTGRTALEGKVVHVHDVNSDPEYNWSEAQQLGGYRTVLGVPLLRDGSPVGVIIVARTVVQPFTEKQIELVTTFADQAVIAIENVRLFEDVQKRTRELSESLQQQTATADVLKIISRSAFDLRTVLQTLIESAARFCDSDQATILREKDGAFCRTETYGFSQEFMDYFKNIPIEADRGSASGRSLLDGRVVHIPDVTADPEYTLLEVQRLGDYRTILCVPMLREGAPIGVLILTRSEVWPFTDKQIELVTTFADQAAIAIENVRLFESVEARTRELAKSLEDLRTTQDRLVQTQKLGSLGQLTAGIAHEIKNPLNFVNNFSGLSAELIDELQESLKDVSLNEKRRSEITELMDTLRGNLDKVVQHGKRADAIVKNMLLHSREGSGEHRVVDINALVEESLNLAYHGARAEKQGFNITMEQSGRSRT
jgi:GAF domain-containing protein